MKANTTNLLRLIGVMAVAVGVAWAVQVIGFGDSSTFGRFVWVLSAAIIAGAGTGMIYGSIVLAGKDMSAKA